MYKDILLSSNFASCNINSLTPGNTCNLLSGSSEMVTIYGWGLISGYRSTTNTVQTRLEVLNGSNRIFVLGAQSIGTLYNDSPIFLNDIPNWNSALGYTIRTKNEGVVNASDSSTAWIYYSLGQSRTSSLSIIPSLSNSHFGVVIGLVIMTILIVDLLRRFFMPRGR